MAKITDLQEIGILKREDINTEYNKNNQYEAGHKDATGDSEVGGKGKGSAGNKGAYNEHAIVRGSKSNQIKPQIQVSDAGDWKDRESREKAEMMNLFSPENDYSENQELWLKRSDTPIGSDLLFHSFNADPMKNRIMKKTVDTNNGGSKVDKEKRESLQVLNKYASGSDSYLGDMYELDPDIPDQLGF